MRKFFVEWAAFSIGAVMIDLGAMLVFGTDPDFAFTIYAGAAFAIGARHGRKH